MRNLRHVNVDHLHVGWYQSTYFGSFINRALIDSQFNYQHSIEESVVLIYGKFREFFFFLKNCNYFKLAEADWIHLGVDRLGFLQINKQNGILPLDLVVVYQTCSLLDQGPKKLEGSLCTL